MCHDRLDPELRPRLLSKLQSDIHYPSTHEVLDDRTSDTRCCHASQTWMQEMTLPTSSVRPYGGRAPSGRGRFHESCRILSVAMAS